MASMPCSPPPATTSASSALAGEAFARPLPGARRNIAECSLGLKTGDQPFFTGDFLLQKLCTALDRGLQPGKVKRPGFREVPDEEERVWTAVILRVAAAPHKAVLWQG